MRAIRLASPADLSPALGANNKDDTRMNWYYEENGQTVGPVSTEEMTHLFHARAIHLKTRVRSEGADA